MVSATISPGAAWLGTERYDIIAKAGGPAPVPQLRLMLQALLADRFGLLLHHESKERSVLIIGVGENGPNLTAATESGSGEMKVVDGSLLFEHYTLAEIAERLSATLGRPVDGQESWVFNLSVPVAGGIGEMKIAAERESRGHEPNDPSPYVAAFRKVGLKLEGRKTPVDVIVIDRAEKVPKAN